jgi:hypothetical protein
MRDFSECPGPALHPQNLQVSEPQELAPGFSFIAVLTDTSKSSDWRVMLTHFSLVKVLGAVWEIIW